MNVIFRMFVWILIVIPLFLLIIMASFLAVMIIFDNETNDPTKEKWRIGYRRR